MSDLLAFAGWWLAQSWRFFSEITVPGTNFTFAALLLGVFFAALGLRLLGYILGFGVSLHAVFPRRGAGAGKGSEKK